MEISKILTGLTEWISGLNERRPSAGRKYLVQSLAEDAEELVGLLRKEVLEPVSRDIVLDADEGIDYAAMAEKLQPLIPVVLQKSNAAEEEACENLKFAVERLTEMLTAIADELDRHRTDEEYERLYERELKIFMKNKGMRRAKRAYDRWRECECLGAPTMEDLEEYRKEKLLNLFRTGIFSERVARMRGARHYADEIMLPVPDDETVVTAKDIHKHYYCLRKLCDYDERGLTLNPLLTGIYFYTHRKEDNAKEFRRLLLKYITKIDLAQREMMLIGQKVNLPSVLTSDEATRYWERLKEKGFVNANWRLLPTTTRKQAMYIAEAFAEKFKLKTKWKPFEELWGLNNLAQEKWDMQQTGTLPPRGDEIDEIFEE